MTLDSFQVEVQLPKHDAYIRQQTKPRPLGGTHLYILFGHLLRRGPLDDEKACH
jgi:hypothetical protein